MPVKQENYGYPAVWHDVSVHESEGYASVMTDYHVHSYYEISLILSGEVCVRLPAGTDERDAARLVLSAPGVPHYITCAPPTLYRRVNIVFSAAFIAEETARRPSLLSAFGPGGRVLPTDDEETGRLYAAMDRLRSERDAYRRRLLLLYLLSLVEELAEAENAAAPLPTYLGEALAFLHEHYAEKITAESLARRVGVGRTTLLVGLRRHTGRTLLDHLVETRLSFALVLLRDGCTEREIAARCGFSDASHFHMAFKRHFGMTPRMYLSTRENLKNANKT